MSRESLSIAEIPYQSGSMRQRYARYLADDGSRWIRHGLFQSFYEDGVVASEGEYKDGLEAGIWREFHRNSNLAAEGEYRAGKEVGRWRFWFENGELEKEVVYFDGIPVQEDDRRIR